MNNWVLFSIGFLAQLLFSLRLIIQWVSSEKQHKVVAPTLFWILSLIASYLLFIYGYLRHDFAIMLGQLLTYFIYIRNLQLQSKWHKLKKGIRWFFLLSPVIIMLVFINMKTINFDLIFKNEVIPFWLLMLGIISQLIFTLRFILQWLHSEKERKSELPFEFWLMSLIGSTLIIIYAILRKDPVLFIGHLFGLGIYIRNIKLLKRRADKN